jgi:hypothetical protein
MLPDKTLNLLVCGRLIQFADIGGCMVMILLGCKEDIT